MPINLQHDEISTMERIRRLFNRNNVFRTYAQVAQMLKIEIATVRSAVSNQLSEFVLDDGTFRLQSEEDSSYWNEFVDRFGKPTFE